jgi:hypothetical protein
MDTPVQHTESLGVLAEDGGEAVKRIVFYRLAEYKSRET